MIDIILEDPNFLVVDKPGGLSTQPLKTKGQTSVTGILSEKYPELKSVGGTDWGAVHRLDRETSGLLLIARNQETYDFFRKQFSSNLVEKEYTALVIGTMRETGKIDWPIGPDPKSAKRVKVYKNRKEATRHRAREAVTFYEPIHARATSPSLLRIRIKTGRRHQIRAHLASAGYPIVGDTVYGLKNNIKKETRLYLHASRLKFRHPRPVLKKNWVEVTSEPAFPSKKNKTP